MIGKIPRSKLRFEVSIVEHCNLNCCMCDHFSPLAEKELIDIHIFEQDLKILSQIFNGEAEYIYLLGGEPLLHPALDELCRIARQYFPECPIAIYTNGILLPSQGQPFWDAVKKYAISFIITRYPLAFHYEMIESVLSEKGISYMYSPNLDHSDYKIMRYNPMDVQGRQDPGQSFRKCTLSNNCVTLAHGKLYTCSIIPSIGHINRYFNLYFIVCQEDGIDLYDKNITARKIMLELSRPVPFCRYCYVKKRKSGFPWGVSEKQASEWLYREDGTRTELE